jgi:hypothetical protein
MTSLPRLWPACALAALLAGPAVAQDREAAAKPVTLAAETQHKLGLTTQPLAAATRADTQAGYVKVLDPGPLAQLDSDIVGAEAAAAASAAEAARSRTLNAADQAVSTKAMQAAEAQARTDASKLALLRRRVGLEWGAGVARLSGRQRGALLAEIAAGKAALVRIDTASGQGLAGLRGLDIDLGAMGRVHAVVLGAARAADIRLLSSGLIAKASGPKAGALSVGLSLPVTLAVSGPVTGVVAPRAALVRSQGKTWVYVRTAAETFVRKPVEDGRAEAGGLFAAAGFKPGEAVVTRGAAALFAAETNAGEDGGD